MLTKDLLRTKTAGKYLHPLFIPSDQPEWLDFARELMTLYREGVGQTREYIENAAASCVNQHKDVKIAGGIHKVISDHADFGLSGAEDCRERRERVFEASAAAIREGKLPEKPEEFRPSLADALQREGNLYADLPENDRLKSVREMFPREILERYNMSLVQSLLLYATKLEVAIPADSGPQLLRALCRYIRFFRLLVSASIRENVIHLTVDGPASIFDMSTKYGLQLASFFPVICRFPKWKASGTVKLKTEKRLLLDESSKLVCHFTNLSSFQPEEIKMFASYFEQNQNCGWTIDGAPGFLQKKDGTLIFPDFSFHSADGRTKYVELFHRWHAHQLEERLKDCSEGKISDLLIGVDRFLLKKDGILKNELESNGYFVQNGFFFRDFPGVKNVLELLDGQQNNLL